MKRVVVTGGNGGIGSAIVTRLLQEGSDVVSLDYSGRAPDGAVDIHCDVTNLDSVKTAFESLDDLWKEHAPTLFVACAGISRPGHLLSMPAEDFEAMMAVNIRGVFLTAQAAGMRMARAVDQSEETVDASMVFISSVAAQQAWACEAGYSATKAAVSSLTQGFAVDLAPYKIPVNAVAPGPIDHGSENMATTRTDPDIYRHEIERTPLARLGSPEEVAESVLRLAQMRWVTGQVITVDGGYMATGLNY
ncbi:MAG: SDR family oxidoreductase, partial [Pseudomonadota bacterium]